MRKKKTKQKTKKKLKTNHSLKMSSNLVIKTKLKSATWTEEEQQINTHIRTHRYNTSISGSGGGAVAPSLPLLCTIEVLW